MRGITTIHSITIHAALLYARALLKQSRIESYVLDSRLLLTYVTDFSYEVIAGTPERCLDIAQFESYKQLVERRANREPIAHILNRREFWGLDFYVTKDTLDPRPDSETLVEAALRYFPDKTKPLRILDLGTGTGCLLLALLTEYKNAAGTGIDISLGALEVAKRNALHLGLAQRTEFILQYWGTGLTGNYDLIISNPPYIEEGVIPTLEPEVAQYEPHLALSGGVDGLDCYRALIPDIATLLADNGIAVIEFGKGQEHYVTEILATHYLRVVGYGQDLAATVRCVIATHENKDS